MKPRTYILVVVDESTSMLGIAAGVRTNINDYLEFLDDEDRDCYVTVVTFAESHRMLCIAATPQNAVRLDAGNYRPNGNTALLDALGFALTSFDCSVERLGPDEKVLLLLATDGADNASRHFTPDSIMDMVTDRERGGQWTFINVAAGPEAHQQSLDLGLRNVIAIAQADFARRGMYSSLTNATRAWAAGGSVEDVTGAFDTALLSEYEGTLR